VSTTKPKGKFSYQLPVTTNDAETPRAVVTCEGFVKQPLGGKVGGVFFGRLAATAGPVEKTVEITPGDGGPIKLALRPFQSPNVEASLKEIEPGQRYELTCRVSPPWPESSVVRAVLLLDTGIPQAPVETLTVHAAVVPRLSVMPAYLRLPAPGRPEREAMVQLMWTGGEPGKITGCKSSHAEVQAAVEDRYNFQYVVVRVADDFECPAAPRPTITVTTDDEDATTLEIPVHSARASKTPFGAAGRVPPGAKTETGK